MPSTTGGEARPFSLDEEASAAKLLAHVPFFTLALALFLSFIFAAEKRLAFDVGRDGALSVESLVAFGAASYDLVVRDHEWWRVFLAPLLHASLGHLLGNCFALLLVGALIEARLGRGWLAAIFTFSALTGVAGSLLKNPHEIPTAGASGAITGLIAALFVVSFHSRCDPVEQESMRRMAIRLGVPALGPMLYQASTGVDYAAHLAGAIGGGVLGYLVTTAWTAESFRPPFARRAAAAAFSVLLVACVSLAFAASQFRARAELAAERIPAKAIPVALPADAKLVADLVARYPKDPRGRLLRGHALAAKGAFGAAETELRQAVSLSTRPYDARVRMTANSYLALVVMKRGGSTEAAQLAKEGCATKELRPLREMLRAARLCNESPEARLPLAISRAPGQSLRPRGAAPQYNGLGR